ncbi:MAG: hypothetical protein HY741_01825 [Chloroflexi bacterium]|nr:hypothetical protein [Chloroflexota bacterium]
MTNRPTDPCPEHERGNSTNRPIWLGLLFLFSIPALSPLVTSTPTQSADGLLHLYRLVQLDALWRQGILFSRWLPDLAYGYGMPLFNYYAPLVYYLTTPLHLIGIPFSVALNLSLAAALFVGASGMFFFTRALVSETRGVFGVDATTDTNDETQNRRDTSPARFENPAGLAALVAALAFLYAPYAVFNTLHRGNLAEVWALAFAPFALWRFFALTQNPNAWNWTLAVLTFAAVMLSHNVTGFIFAPLLFGLVLVRLISSSHSLLPGSTATHHASRLTFDVSRFTFRASLITFSAFALALALSAFFWLPALLERDYVQIARVIVTPDFDYRFNFVSPAELIALVPRADTGRLNPLYPNTLGVVQVGLGVAGICLVTVFARTRRALPLFYLALAAFGLTLLMLAVAQPVWDNLTLLSFVQLPMRVRGLVALCLAPCAGIFVFAIPTRWRAVAVSITSIAIVLSALPLLYPRYARDVPLNPTLTDMFAYEQRTGAFGTTSFGEYLPVWVQEPPDKSPFAEPYARNTIPDRFVLPEGVTVCGAEISPTAQQLCANAQTAWRAIYRTFYFPGWRAFVDGRAVEITPTPRTGLIAFDVANGANIRVAYVGTDVEHVSEWISTASAILVLGILIFTLAQSRRREKTTNETSPRPLSPQSSSLIPHPSLLLTLSLVALALIAFKALYADRVSNPFVAHFDGIQVNGIAQPRDVKFDDALQWLGYDVSANRVARGETLRVTLYWRALSGLNRNLSTFVHLTAPDGFVLAQKDSLHPANLPTTRWELDAYGADEHAFQIPAELAPGEYELRGGVYDPATNTRLKTPNGADYVPLGKITVK